MTDDSPAVPGVPGVPDAVADVGAGHAAELRHWLLAHADALDQGHDQGLGETLVPRLAAAGVLHAGLPAQAPGRHRDAVERIAALAGLSLTAGFVAWGQRSFLEYLQHTPNRALAERLQPALLGGELAGATALSNAMKFLCGIEPLQISARADGRHWVLDGHMPWVTNLGDSGYVVAAPVRAPEGGLAVLALAHDLPGLQRGADVPLVGLQASHTARIDVRGVRVVAADCLLASAPAAGEVPWLARVRPPFLALQCGLSIGLARRCLAEAQAALRPGTALQQQVAQAQQQLAQWCEQLYAGVDDGRFVTQPAGLFELRIALTEAALQAAALELQALGSSSYLKGHTPGFWRRWREAAFLPIITPSLVQLRTELARLQA